MQKQNPKAQQETKRQHTVPAMYLRGFACDEACAKIFQFSRKTFAVKQIGIRRKATVREHAYTIHNHPKLSRMFLEDAFGQLESKAAPPLTKLRGGACPDDLSDDERFVLAELFAVQIKRTEAMLDHRVLHAQKMKDVDTAVAFIETIRAELERRYSKHEVETYIAQLRTSESGVQIENEDLLLASFVNLQYWAEAVFELNWRVELAPTNMVFATSDNPVFVRRRGRPRDSRLVGILRSDLEAEMYVPISSTRLLIASFDKPRRRRRASPLRVQELNRLTTLMANEHVYASQESSDIMNLVKQEKDFQLTLPDRTTEVLSKSTPPRHRRRWR